MDDDNIIKMLMTLAYIAYIFYSGLKKRKKKAETLKDPKSNPVYTTMEQESMEQESMEQESTDSYRQYSESVDGYAHGEDYAYDVKISPVPQNTHRFEPPEFKTTLEPHDSLGRLAEVGEIKPRRKRLKIDKAEAKRMMLSKIIFERKSFEL